jgi:hypothetical protein
VDPFGGLGIAERICAVHGVDKALEQQAGDHEIREAGHQAPADRARRALAHPAVEQMLDPAVQATQAAPDQQDQGVKDRHPAMSAPQQPGKVT